MFDTQHAKLASVLALWLHCADGVHLHNVVNAGGQQAHLEWQTDLATHAVMPRLAWNHHHRHRQVRQELKRHLWLFGSHHKAGTVLLHRLAMIQSTNTEEPFCSISNLYGPCGTFGPSCWNEEGVRIWFDCHVTGQSLTKVRALAAGQLRAILVLRDPVAMVVSGYVYHMQSDDGIRTSLIRDVNLAEGVQLEAKRVIRDSLPEMLSAYQDGRANQDVLIVRLEEFMNSSASFDATVARLYNYSIGDIVGTQKIAKMVELASAEDLSRHPTSEHSTSFTNPELKRKAALALQSIPKDLMKQLHDYRAALGYM
mmetsp:Transcript_62481/g.177446  ORF Transcript_62481/g.177446 Transcript_62481/m.177446 type:complete len:312 (+) Transcript_62481:77-1012(+)